MPKVQVYEPAMCCSTGVCGPSVDPALVRFAADAEWLKGQGVAVERANLSQQPQAFVASSLVRESMQQGGVESLPLVLIDGAIAFTGTYPTRRQLADKLGLEAPPEEPSFGDDLLELLPMADPPGGKCC